MCLLLVGSASVRAERRVALVVGNAAYTHATRLQNPVNDAVDMKAKLEKLGFEVTFAKDQSSDAFFDAVQAFSNKLTGADVALFYYSGHGMQYEGTNYLVPVDTKIDGQFTLKRKTVSAQDVVEQMERGAKVSLVFLDACRNNTLMRDLEQALPQQSRSGASNRGLARMEPRGSNTLVVFATAPNDVASDGTGSRNSPFTSALLKHIDAPGVVIQEMLTDVTADVERTTGGKQRPEILMKLTSKVRLAATAAVAPTPVVVQPAPPVTPLSSGKERDARDAWAAIENTCDKDRLAIFRQRYGETYFGDLARLRLAELESGRACGAAAAVAVPSPVSGPEPTVPDIAMIRAIQTELKRVGCFTSSADGKYGDGSRKAAEQFVKSRKIDVAAVPSSALLDAIRVANGRVCPLVCDDDEHVQGDRCVPKQRSPEQTVAPAVVRTAPNSPTIPAQIPKQESAVSPVKNASDPNTSHGMYNPNTSLGGTCGPSYGRYGYSCTDARGRHCTVVSGQLTCR